MCIDVLGCSRTSQAPLPRPSIDFFGVPVSATVMRQSRAQCPVLLRGSFFVIFCLDCERRICVQEEIRISLSGSQMSVGRLLRATGSSVAHGADFRTSEARESLVKQWRMGCCCECSSLVSLPHRASRARTHLNLPFTSAQRHSRYFLLNNKVINKTQLNK